MDVYLARQPIFTADKKIFAYELLFRESIENIFPGINGDSATSRLLSNTFFTANIEQISGGKRVFINFTRELITRQIPLMLPPQITTVEILENITPDEELLVCCREFANQGYMLALDDFTYNPVLEGLIDLADIIKIDFLLSTRDQIKDYAARFTARGKLLLAEKVETLEEFETARRMGFSYFQGYFFSRPQVIRETDIPTLKVNLLGIMSEVIKESYLVDTLQHMIERDVGISYKLLRYLNSPFYRRPQEITSIHQAIIMLGEKGIRQFLSVIIMAELSQDKPDELLKSSVIRANMCAMLVRNSKNGLDPDELFMLGLFSHIDAILDNSMENILSRLPLSVGIKNTLLGQKTLLSDYIDLVINYQHAQWEKVAELASILEIPHERLPEVYVHALCMADAACCEELAGD